MPVLFAPALSCAKDSVTWMEAVMPPYFIQSGTLKDQGYGDQISRIIQEGLTDYQHEEMVTNITRHFYKFKQGEKVCSVGLFRTPEREEFMHFSMPSFLTLPAVIIIRKEALPEFAGQTTVRLADILKNTTITLGLAKDRSYGSSLDEVLKQHRGSKNTVEVSGPELSLNLFKMLMKGRLDGILGLPEEALYQAEQLGIRDQLMTLTIEENLNGYEAWQSSVGCSKNAWGKAIIDRINAVLLAQRPTERYRAAYERWLDPNAIEQYRKVYEEVFLKKTQ
jgi:uncharacterized protein (TIGR02285 family)